MPTTLKEFTKQLKTKSAILMFTMTVLSELFVRVHDQMRAAFVQRLPGNIKIYFVQSNPNWNLNSYERKKFMLISYLSTISLIWF